MFDLISEAQCMLLDREKSEADLIYAIAKLDEEERSAIIIAYQIIHKDFEKKENKKSTIKTMTNAPPLQQMPLAYGARDPSKKTKR